MKTLVIILAFTFLQVTGTAQSNNTETTEFTVLGNCGMCKKRIEKALKVEGVESAEWNSKDQLATVTYQSDKINEGRLHQLVADAGHDTEKVLATDKAYDKLHGCCQYERNEKVSGKEIKKDNQHKH